MNGPTAIQFQQLRMVFDHFELPIPVYCRKLDDGAIQIDAGAPYVIRNATLWTRY